MNILAYAAILRNVNSYIVETNPCQFLLDLVGPIIDPSSCVDCSLEYRTNSLFCNNFSFRRHFTYLFRTVHQPPTIKFPDPAIICHHARVSHFPRVLLPVFPRPHTHTCSPQPTTYGDVDMETHPHCGVCSVSGDILGSPEKTPLKSGFFGF